MYLLESCVIAISMYSKIPMPRVEWKEKNMKYAMCFFPLVGCVNGILVFGLGNLLSRLGTGKLFFAAAMTLLPLLVTGGIHMDGYMDTLDALNSYGDKEKKLAILKDPNTGAFAVLGLAVYLLWSVALWSEASPKLLPVVALGYVLSRGLSGLSVVAFPVARDSGLAKTFQDGAKRKTVGITMVVWLLAASAAMLWYSPLLGAAVLLAAALAFWYYRGMCKRKFGGITGDLAGYFLQVCELAVLTVAVLVGGIL